MASQWPPKKNTAFTLYFSLYKSDGTIIANPGTYTKKVSIDGAAVADITAAVTEEDTTYGQLSVVLAAGEMNGDAIWVYIKDDTAGCVPFTCTIYTAGSLHDEVKADTAAILADTGTDGVVLAADAITSAKIADNAIAAEHLADNAIGLATFAADVKTGSALKANVETVTANAITAAAIADGAIDAATFAADALLRLGIVTYGTAQAADATSIQLASASAFADDELNGAVVVITGGTGVGQSRVITDYVGSTDTATVDTWTTTPSGTITYVVFAAAPASATSLPAVNVTQVAGTSQTAGDLAALITTVDGVVDDILTDTGTTLPATLGSPAGASLAADIAAIEAQTDDIGTEIAAIKAKTDALPASPAAVGSAMTLANDAVSADALSAAAVDKILDEVVEGQGNITLRQSLMAILAFAAGQASGGGTTECVFESPNGVATRITMTVNSAGDRSAVTLNFE